MSSSLIEQMMSLASPQLIGSLASRLSESEAGVQDGLKSGSATILGALAAKSTEAGFLDRILRLAPGANGDVATALSAIAGGTATDSPVSRLGANLLSQLFGPQEQIAARLIARGSALRADSAANLLQMAAPMFLSVLNQRMRQDNLSGGSLGSLLKAESSGVAKLIPAGISSLLDIGRSAAAAPASAPSTASARRLGIIAAVVALLALFALLSRCNGFSQVAGDATRPEQPVSTSLKARPAIPGLGDFVHRRLPNGTELEIPVRGIENRLIDFIEDEAKAADKTTWFNFDRLLFDTGKATLQPFSTEQLRNITAILAAYPAVKVKIGGYTDNTGSAGTNLELSSNRAKNVAAELAALGVNPSRLESEGYGSEHPVADNSTEEGRAQNRRIALRVTEK